MCSNEWNLSWAHKTQSFERRDTYVYIAHMPHGHPKKLSTLQQSRHMNNQGISDSDVISFVIKTNIINSSIPRPWNIHNGENNALEK
jgi:hypothetical protein